jgi:hypothetical protein
MKKILLLFFWILTISHVRSQNLVTNPNAEGLPRGTGWTIVSQGTAACVFAPTDNYINWTLIPDGTANYPYDHTIGAAGGTVFYAGCSAAFGGPFELQQTIDVGADAATIDAGSQLYTFSGYIQTPVTSQSDQGRYIVDYLNASNTILGTSYTSSWQSILNSGSAWIFYTNTRLAPVGTRKIRIRMQSQLFFNQYAVNVYFDDISLTKPVVLPVNLVSFTGNEAGDKINLNWKTGAELNFTQYELEKSTDGTNFSIIAVIPGGKTNYNFIDNNEVHSANKYFYRLKMKDTDGKTSYSKIVTVNTRSRQSMALSPNPATNSVTLSGLYERGTITIINSSGTPVLTTKTNGPTTSINISQLPAGYTWCDIRTTSTTN